MIKQLALILLLLIPLALLPTNKPAFNLAEERKLNGTPRPPAQPNLITDSIEARPVPSALPPAHSVLISINEPELKERQENKEELEEKETNEMIDARAIALRLTKDCSNRPRCAKQNEGPIAPIELMAKVIQRNDTYSLNYLLHVLNGFGKKSMTALNAAALAGDIEKFQLTFRQRTPDDDSHKIKVKTLFDIIQALRILIDCSLLERSSEKCQRSAAILFRNFGLPTIPQYENYPLIASELIHTAVNLIMHEESPRSMDIQHTAVLGLQALLQRAMTHGSTELLQVIAEGVGKNPNHVFWKEKLSFLIKMNGANSVFEQTVFDTINGGKLGILLSIDAHPESMTYQLAMGMLSHVEKNPRLLSHLKKYVRKHQKILALIDEQLPAALVPIVLGYASYCMPAGTAEYILNLHPAEIRPVEEDNSLLGQQLTSMLGDDEEESLLGQHMTSIITRRRQLRD